MNWIKQIGLAVLFLSFLGFAATAFAVPVKPDLEKILKQQEQRNRSFEPAQAGWNGPEMQRAQDASPNVVLETYGPAATERAVRAALAAAAIPDPKAVIAIAGLILLMRIMVQAQTRERRRAPVVAMHVVESVEKKKKAA
jgi:hypothetical protein